MSTPQPADQGLSMHSALPMLVVNVACPHLTYHYVRQYAPGTTEIVALALAGVLPALGNLLSLARRRVLDIIGVVVLVSIVAAFFGGDPRLLLIRQSFVTGALEIVCLLSRLLPRLLLVYIGRDFTAGRDPARIAAFDAVWQYPYARRTLRIMTTVWRLRWVGEFLAKGVAVAAMPVSRVLVIGPIVSNGTTIAPVL